MSLHTKYYAAKDCDSISNLRKIDSVSDLTKPMNYENFKPISKP